MLTYGVGKFKSVVEGVKNQNRKLSRVSFIKTRIFDFSGQRSYYLIQQIERGNKYALIQFEFRS